MERCGWANGDELMAKYHDEEWGIPTHSDRKHFEFMILEAFQAGLSWMTILRKREAFKKAFAGFDPEAVAKFDQTKVSELLNDKRIVRNRLKIEAAITNARKFIEIQKEFGSFDKYIWGFVEGKPIVHKQNDLSEIPATTELSDIISKDLKKRGFKFVGSTIVYSHLQAVGIVNDHLLDCPRYQAAAGK
ncbi:DNA-3-methyladenine glycosylase I [Dehalogenimonas etheniformans]|uniref:DNA-3-methyladenine glycosylase I n=1 Tax=Dehalogenimonas etheniformans TaxID=1536648 RepID=A0A2P5P5N3_9CHLR|nr:DNA-3-methyladenine glycosylase I [Dehalogenimonas etheniformans]PPD57612.1 DNA-3-methyladenine glycosylase I [Dehalogenimonas etheniformans]QNT75952.1 DNA-3-methyladenine glycosylase I [Dehalogenimonas etheniformans]